MDQKPTQQTPATPASSASRGGRPSFGGGNRASGGPGGRPSFGGNRAGGAGGGRGNSRGGRPEREVREFEQKTLALDRVTRVTAGGKRMSFRAAIIIGDKKGRVGFAVEKGVDVQISMDKAYRTAKKHLVKVPLVNGTIPHMVWMKFGSAVVMLKPAPNGTGLKAGGAVRSVLELAGVPNAVSKIVNSKNKLNIAKATIDAIRQLRMPPPKVAKAQVAAPVSGESQAPAAKPAASGKRVAAKKTA